MTPPTIDAVDPRAPMHATTSRPPQNPERSPLAGRVLALVEQVGIEAAARLLEQNKRTVTRVIADRKTLKSTRVAIDVRLTTITTAPAVADVTT